MRARPSGTHGERDDEDDRVQPAGNRIPPEVCVAWEAATAPAADAGIRVVRVRTGCCSPRPAVCSSGSCLRSGSSQVADWETGGNG